MASTGFTISGVIVTCSLIKIPLPLLPVILTSVSATECWPAKASASNFKPAVEAIGLFAFNNM